MTIRWLADWCPDIVGRVVVVGRAVRFIDQFLLLLSAGVMDKTKVDLLLLLLLLLLGNCLLSRRTERTAARPSTQKERECKRDVAEVAEEK